MNIIAVIILYYYIIAVIILYYYIIAVILLIVSFTRRVAIFIRMPLPGS